MKIRNIHLESILSHKETMLELESLSCVRGENGAGKSTIVVAAQTVVSGICEYTDDRGTGIKSLIRIGEEKCGITLDILDDGESYTLHNSITLKSGRLPKCTKASDPMATCKDYVAGLAMNRDVLACLFNGAYFFEKDEKDQKKLLASLILPKQIDFAPWVWEAVRECGLQIDRSQPAFDIILAAHKAAFDERRDTNRLLKEWREPEKPEPQTMSLQEIKDRLKARQDERTAAALLRATTIRRWEDSQAEQKRALVQLNGEADALGNTTKIGLHEKLTRESERRRELEGYLLAKAALKEHEKLAAAETVAAEIQIKIAANNEELRAARRALATFNDTLDAGKCPTCTREMPEDTWLEISNRMSNAVTTLERKDNELQQQLKGLGDWAGAKKNIEVHQQAEKSLETLTRRLADLQKEIDAAHAVLDAQAQAQPDTTAIDAEITSLDTRIERGNIVLQEAVRADTLAKAHADAVTRRTELTKKVENLEKLVSYFGADGILSKILSTSVAPFQASMNAVLKSWGYACALSFDPYRFEVALLEAAAGQGIPLRTLSKSQRASFQLAFQVSLALVTGYKFVWVDAADIWLDEPRRAMYQAVLSATGLDQVVVFQSDTRREIPNRPGSSFYMLKLDRSSGIPTTVVKRLQ